MRPSPRRRVPAPRVMLLRCEQYASSQSARGASRQRSSSSRRSRRRVLTMPHKVAAAGSETDGPMAPSVRSKSRLSSGRRVLIVASNAAQRSAAVPPVSRCTRAVILRRARSTECPGSDKASTSRPLDSSSFTQSSRRSSAIVRTQAVIGEAPSPLGQTEYQVDPAGRRFVAAGPRCLEQQQTTLRRQCLQGVVDREADVGGGVKHVGGNDEVEGLAWNALRVRRPLDVEGGETFGGETIRPRLA